MDISSILSAVDYTGLLGAISSAAGAVIGILIILAVISLLVFIFEVWMFINTIMKKRWKWTAIMGGVWLCGFIPYIGMIASLASLVVAIYYYMTLYNKKKRR